MKTITFECEIITPMFLCGADGKTPELRPPSIKGALRFWWRAMNGDLSLEELKKKEVEIFGGGGDKARRSNVIIRVENHREVEKNLKVIDNKPVPHKDFQIKSFDENQKFNIILNLTNDNIISIEQLFSLFQLVCILGGFGKRARRGMGSLKINKYKIENNKWIENNHNIDLKRINYLLNTVNENKFSIDENNTIIKSNFNRDEKFPYIKTIQIGEIKNNLLLLISKKTNELHSRDGYKFSMGYADKSGRFASPIFVSVITKDQAIITTMNTIPKENFNINQALLDIQNDFKNSILYMEKYLFLFTIGPVQSFIAQARKTQDLYAGSYILSELMKFAHKYITDNDKNAEIIFPQLTKHNISATHRILAIITDTTICKKLEESIRNELLNIARKIKLINDNYTNCEFQLKDFLQVYWIAKEIENEEFNYKEIESLLGSVKNIRVFQHYAETGRKCSLCGERNALFIGKSENKPSFTEKAIEIESFLVNPREGLCAVCATKRFHETPIKFPSTAEIAQLDIKEIIENNPSFKLYKSLFKEKFDYQLLYKENITLKYFKKHNLIDFKIDQKSIEELTKNIFLVLKEKKLKQKKYYALLQFDGDSMGALMAGDFLEDKNQFCKEYQKNISELLSEFSFWAKRFVDGENDDKIRKGQTVYAGGDDFLAFINLEYLFDTLTTLRKEFKKQVNDKIQENYKLKKDFTFSAGICIAHYKIPLKVVLDYTRQMEKTAKKIDGKDALAIAVIKHSGEINKSVLKWNNGQNTEFLKYITEKLKNDDFSSTFISNFDREFRNLINEKGEFFEEHIIKVELKRLLLRSCKKEWNKNKKSEEVEKMQENIISLLNDYNLSELINLLNICDFIVRKTS